MSLSRNRDIFNSKFMILSIVIFTVFTVSLTENLQLADGLLATLSKLNYELESGDTQLLTWNVINDEEVPIDVEFYADGEGSELLIFEQFLTLAPKENKVIEVIVIAPDNVDNVEYRPILHVLQKGTLEEGKSGMVINVRLNAPTTIKIGDNAVFVPEEQIEEVEVTAEIESPELIDKVEEVDEGETLEEKLARIQAANEAKQITTDDKTIIDAGSQENRETTTIPSKIIPDEGFIPEPISDEGEGGGCLIATAAYGSEMAPQVQLLREIRDNQLMNTDSGISFMTGFNQLYYSFSPFIADMERENPAFKEIVKIGITPLLSSLSMMEYAESDSEVLGYGIGVILLNLGMYVGIPAFGIVKVFQIRRK